MDRGDWGIVAVVGVMLIVFAAFAYGAYLDGIEKEKIENERIQNIKDSVKEEIVTIDSISPVPGVKPNGNGQIMVTNADQLMFWSTGGKGFQNTEDKEIMNKTETRDLLMNLKIGGTYKIKYYGIRDGNQSNFPNILYIVEVKDESNATKNLAWADFFGDWNKKDPAQFRLNK